MRLGMISPLLGNWLFGLQGAVVPGPSSHTTARINDLYTSNSQPPVTRNRTAPADSAIIIPRSGTRVSPVISLRTTVFPNQCSKELTIVVTSSDQGDRELPRGYPLSEEIARTIWVSLRHEGL